MKKIGKKEKHQRIVGYVRVSSREQAFDSHALEQQIERVKTAGAQEIFQDVQSGKKDHRPALKEVMELVRQGLVDEVIITRIDRLARSLTKLRECIDIFLESGVNFRILDQQIDLSTSQGKLMANILGSLAEWEVDLLSERIKHGKQHRRNQHKACENYPWGYKIANDRYALNDSLFLCLLSERPNNYRELSDAPIAQLPGLTVQEIARDCVEIFLQQKTLSKAVKAIFKKYGLVKTSSKKSGNDGILHWSKSGFKTWLRNPVLQGHTVYLKKSTTREGKEKLNDQKDWQYVYNTHPEHRLISDEEYQEIEQIMELNRDRGPLSLHDLPQGNNYYRTYDYQKGLVFCAECGSKCMTKSSKYKDGRYYYYACRHAGAGCNNLQSTQKETIEKAIISTLLEKSLNLAEESKAFTSKQPEKSARLLKLEAKLKTLSKIEDFDPEIEKLKSKTQQEIAEDINPFLSNSLEQKSAEEIIRAGNNLAIWHTLSNDEKVVVYRKLIHKITIRNAEVESVVLKI